MIDTGSIMINSIIGGAILALAITLHLYLQGKKTDISGSLSKTILFSEFSYYFSFIIGMLCMSSLLKCFFDPSIKYKYKNKYSSTYLETPSKYVGDLSFPGFILAGFLVGFGSKMANGCTSGHIMYGLPRLSKRSIIAVSLFFIFGILIATIRYYHPFLLPEDQKPYKVLEWSIINYLTLILGFGGYALNLWKTFKSGIENETRDNIISFLIGALFAFGLIQSGILQRHIVVNFLTIAPIWDIQLAFILVTVVAINFITLQYIVNKISKPLLQIGYEYSPEAKIDNKLCIGAAIFGVGWGLAGICPGPAILTFYLYCPQTLGFLVSLCAGIYLENFCDSKISSLINKEDHNITSASEFGHFDEEKLY